MDPAVVCLERELVALYNGNRRAMEMIVFPICKFNVMAQRRAFTLVELLIVVAIVMILAGISFKIMGLVGNRSGVAKTTMILEQVRNALGAYYGTYGSYPPVNEVRTEAPYMQPLAMTNNPFLLRGLTAYLMTGRLDSNGGTTPPMTQAYMNPEAARWEHYLSFALANRGGTITNLVQGANVMDYTNAGFRILDAWGCDIRYVGTPPDYQSYLLWSEGPTGNTNDDIYVTYQ
jgi:prepilin-type N-terminal cleavage/methylation domain-containing protein